MMVSHRGRRLRRIARHGAGARRDDDGRLGITDGDLAIDAGLVVSTVGGERRDRAINLVEQSADLRGIVDVIGGQRRRRDLPSVGVHGDVQLAPGSPDLCAMLAIVARGALSDTCSSGHVVAVLQHLEARHNVVRNRQHERKLRRGDLARRFESCP